MSSGEENLNLNTPPYYTIGLCVMSRVVVDMLRERRDDYRW